MLPSYSISGVPLNELPKPVFGTANQRRATVIPRYAGNVAAKRMAGTYGPVNEVVRSNMEKFQMKNGVPVHLKGGAFDRLLFGATVGLCFVGVGMTLHMIYDMAMPKKK